VLSQAAKLTAKYIKKDIGEHGEKALHKEE